MTMSKIIFYSNMVLFLMMGCTQNKPQPNAQPECKQESTHAIDWIASWRNCAGDGAIKKDGTLWQLGEVGGCDWEQIYPIDPETGKSIYQKKYVYHLEPKKIGDGFDDAKIINGSYRVYAIKKDGRLWGWGEGLRENPMLLSKSHDWVDFGVKWEGNGCCAHDVGLQKDGSLWRFPEGFDFAIKSPIKKLKKVGTQKNWDKVILNCCTMYALKKDGSIWTNRGTNAGVKFKKFDFKSDCFDADQNLCENLKTHFSKMPSQTIYTYGEEGDLEVNVGVGKLCVMPMVDYK